jgi:O-antigen/teichoic acid export membrane protein
MSVDSSCLVDVAKPTLRDRVARRLPKNKFVQNVGMLIGSTFLAQIVNLAASPVLTRIYSPEEFGLLSIFLSIFSPLLLLMSLRYEQAIPLPESNATAVNLVALCIAITFGTSLTIGIVLFAFADVITTHLHAHALRGYLWLLPITLFAASLYAVFNGWCVRCKEFGAIARTRVGQSLSRTLAQCTLGLLQAKILGLLIGEALGQAAGNGTLAWRFWKKDRRELSAVSVRGIVDAAKCYHRFPLIALPASILNILAVVLPPLFFVAMFGTVYGGFFLISQKLVALPITLLGGAIGQVFYADVASRPLGDPKNLMQFLRLSCVLGGIGLLGVPFFVTAPLWTGPVLGQNWAPVGWVIFAMLPMLLGRLIVSPLSQVYYAFNKHHLLLFLDILRLSLLCLLLFYCGSIGLTFLNTIIWFSGIMCAVYALHWFVLLYILRQGTRDPVPI